MIEKQSATSLAIGLGLMALLSGGAAKAGSYRVLHMFGQTGSDGAKPYAGLTNVGGVFFGTTNQGGTASAGTIFSITPQGSETVLHQFDGTTGGGDPNDLINVGGTLYGTAEGGGSGTSQLGVVFSMSLAGAYNVLYSFASGTGDGNMPNAGLVNINGTLYGTTYAGGNMSCDAGLGCGTVFSITPDGTYKTIYAFKGGSDGAMPNRDLININGTLYGTTSSGGSTGCVQGCGTVFSLTPSGTETVLHHFIKDKNGYFPSSALLYAGNLLYGTTIAGGANGLGTVYSMTLAGTETLVHSFGAAGDGAGPQASLLAVGGTLYGTTASGGTSQNDGIVFALTP